MSFAVKLTPSSLAIPEGWLILPLAPKLKVARILGHHLFSLIETLLSEIW